MSPSDKKYWIKSGSYTLMQRVAMTLFGLASFLLLIRLLPKYDYGIWVLFVSITSIFEVIRNGFIRNPLVKHITSHEEEDHSMIYSASWILNLLYSILIALLILVFRFSLESVWNAAGLSEVLIVYVVTNFLLIPFSQFEYINQSNFDFRGTFWIYFTKQGFFFLYVLYCWFYYPEVTLLNLAIAQAAGVFVAAGIGFIFTKPFIKNRVRFSFKWFGDLFHFGKYTLGTNISTMLFKNTDKWMLGSMMSPAMVALYEPAVKISSLVEIPTMSIATILFPQASKRIREQGEQAVAPLYEKSVGLILALIIPLVIFVLIFPHFVIKILAGAEYVETAFVVQVTIFYALVEPFARQFGIVMDATGKPKIGFYFIVFSAILNVVFNYIFITYYGLVGAAYGTLSSLLIGLIINQVYLSRNLSVSFTRVIKECLLYYKKGLSLSAKYVK
ncbi:flippase [Mangrovivirga sp. M17]|uniref:Flippase n=1 Tax=Mangrovivirga halotolerans TaxID=2993936 RepID=A0ABT3RWG4_9BACT|nr:flippase [Mangrovivirga halotolerans]MCX2745866.1 flippase [Mangrovivirga halotolerans]